MRLPTNDALAALAGTVVNRDRLPGTIAISTDTRDIRPSETFLALRGEHFDGHNFVANAVAAGASVAIVDDARVLPEGQAGIVVDDTLAAYLALGALARDQRRARRRHGGRGRQGSRNLSDDRRGTAAVR